MDGYDEYSGIEYRSVGCSEEYTIIKQGPEKIAEREYLALQGEFGGTRLELAENCGSTIHHYSLQSRGAMFSLWLRITHTWQVVD